MVGGMAICVSIHACYANALTYSTQELELSQGRILMRLRSSPAHSFEVLTKHQERVLSTSSPRTCEGQSQSARVLARRQITHISSCWEPDEPVALSHYCREGMGLLKKTFQIRSIGQSNALDEFKVLQRECSSL